MITKFKHILKFKQLPLFIAFMSLLFPILSVSAINNSTSGGPGSNFFQNNLIFYDPNECFEGSISSSQSSAYIGGSDIEEKIWSGLANMNYKPEIIAGIMGNMSNESGFNPVRYENSHKDVWESGFDWETSISEGYGVGLVQWSGQRRVDFFQYMRKEANDLTDKYLKDPSTYGGLSGSNFLSKANNESDVNSLISIELQYLDQELKNNSSYKGIFNQSTVEDATKFFAANVEGCTKCKDENSETVTTRLDEANRIFQAYNGKSFDGGDSVATTSDYSNIQAAKNADKSVSGVDTSSEWYAGWSDNDTAALKRVLEHYGDLAYQTGRALNVPWQAILVQMRYENPRAMCGSSSSPNNFWGMGCTGGSTAEARSNLGEGFVTYAKYVTNEFQKHAIGIQDPYEYLVELGPSWVQGCLRTSTGWDNGQGSDAGCTGYSEIENMKKSLEVLENYLQTSEGQEIVKSFGNYKVTTSSSSNDEECCNPDSLPSTAGTYKGASYQLNDEDLKTLSRIALNENGRTLASFQSELSLMANRADRFPNFGDVLDYVIQSGWFATGRDHCKSDRTCDYTDEVDSEHLAAAKDIIVNGNRTLPSVVVEHDCFYPECSAGIGSISNDGGNSWISVGSHSEAVNMKDQFKRGETILKQDGEGLSSQYYFWDFADPNDIRTDPFGYYMNESPSASELQPTKGSSPTTAAGSSVTWTDDGWISSGMSGFVKEEITQSVIGSLSLDSSFGGEYATSSPNGQNPGPNKITLHATEGSGDGKTAIPIYQHQKDYSVPPHFTIDLKNHKLYQHVSIWKTSAAVTGDAYAGVQIEIIGYDNPNEDGYNEKWNLANEESFSDSDYAYLAELLNAISVETGIPLTSSVDWGNSGNIRLSQEDFASYEGILGHKHVPNNDHQDLEDPAIWDRIQKALSSFTDAQQKTVCPPASADAAALQNLVKEWVWRKDEDGWDTTRKKPAYELVIEQRQKDGKYVGASGIDCGGFVTTLMQESGWDPDYNTDPSGNTTRQHEYLENSPKWDEITSSIHSNSDALPGDVLIKDGTEGDSWHHTLVYVGKIEGFNYSEMAEAGENIYAPSEGKQVDIMYWVNQGFHVYRNNQPPTNSTASAGGLTYEQAKTFMMNYGENKNDSSLKAAGSYQWYIGGCNNQPDRGLGGSNCVTFSDFFANKFAGLNDVNFPNGFGVGNFLKNKGIKTDHTPAVWSIFSYGGGANHTGVILGKEGDEWIVGHASCKSTGVGRGDGVTQSKGSGVVQKDSDIRVAIWAASNGVSLDDVTFSHLDDRVNISAISNYLNTGE